MDNNYCNICDKFFSTSRSFKRHLGNNVCVKKLSKKSDHICPECGKLFSTKWNLKQHITNVCSHNTNQIKDIPVSIHQETTISPHNQELPQMTTGTLAAEMVFHAGVEAPVKTDVGTTSVGTTHVGTTGVGTTDVGIKSDIKIIPKKYIPISKEINVKQDDIFVTDQDDIVIMNQDDKFIKEDKLIAGHDDKMVSDMGKKIVNIRKKGISLEEENARLRKEIYQLKKLLHINDKLEINQYGKENMEMLTEDLLRSAMKLGSKSIGYLLEIVHFNPNYPENYNIYIKDLKSKFIMVYEPKADNITGNISCDYRYKSRNDVLESIVKKLYKYLNEYYEAHIMHDNNGIKIYETFQNLMDDGDGKIRTSIKNDCHAIILSHSKQVKSYISLKK